MKTQYMNNVPFLPGELTIVTSDHAELAAGAFGAACRFISQGDSRY